MNDNYTTNWIMIFLVASLAAILFTGLLHAPAGNPLTVTEGGACVAISVEGFATALSLATIATPDEIDWIVATGILTGELRYLEPGIIVYATGQEYNLAFTDGFMKLIRIRLASDSSLWWIAEYQTE